MKLFLDSANVDEIKEATSMGVISGITTVSYTHLRAHET